MTDEERFEHAFSEAKEYAISAIRSAKTPEELFGVCATLAKGYGNALLSSTNSGEETVSNTELKDRIRRW